MRVSNGCGTPADSATATVTVCTASCTASASPTSGMAPLDVSFSASFQLHGGCELAYTESFDFGDGTPPAAYVGEHTYVNPGTYTWTYTVAVLGGITCTHTGTVDVCMPASIPWPPQSTAIFSGQHATLTVSVAGSGTPVYQWYQGTSGDTSTPVGTDSSSYTTPALTQTTSYWVRVNNGCGPSADSPTATVTVCTLSCSATVPAKATVGLAAAFAGSASVTGGCASAITYDWNFGDGTAHSSAQSPSHTYASAGAYTWTLTVSAGGVTCTKTGTVTAVNPPVITLMKKVTPPFKIVVTGTNLQSGIRVFIDGAEWTSVVYKKSTKIQITGGTSLKIVVPKGVPKTFRFLNPDGGEASLTWSW